MKKALCLDLGTATGWALGEWRETVDLLTSGCSNEPQFDHKLQITSGTMSFKPQRWEGGGMRYLRFVEWLKEIHASGFDAVFYEEVRMHNSTDAAHVYGGFMGHLTSFCEQRKIPYDGVPVGTIKKHITGRGNANKKLVMIAVEHLGYSPKDDNEADAIALCDYVLRNQPGFKP